MYRLHYNTYWHDIIKVSYARGAGAKKVDYVVLVGDILIKFPEVIYGGKSPPPNTFIDVPFVLAGGNSMSCHKPYIMLLEKKRWLNKEL